MGAAIRGDRRPFSIPDKHNRGDRGRWEAVRLRDAPFATRSGIPLAGAQGWGDGACVDQAPAFRNWEEDSSAAVAELWAAGAHARDAEQVSPLGAPVQLEVGHGCGPL